MYQMIFKLGLLFAIVFNIMVVQVEVRDNLLKKPSAKSKGELLGVRKVRKAHDVKYAGIS